MFNFLQEKWCARALTWLILLSPMCVVSDDVIENHEAGLIESYFRDWFQRVAKTRSEQPTWIPPLVTVTPRLGQELRYDQFWQSRPNSQTFNSFSGGKGLALIPAERIEFVAGIPAFQETYGKDSDTGWADENLLLKYRLLAANPQNGDYVLTAFAGATLPTGTAPFTTHHTLFNPGIGAGKGWGDFDIQSTLGTSIPDGDIDQFGTPIIMNTTFQYHVLQYLWPEFEMNYTYWPNGDRAGIHQLYLTPGILFGRFQMLEHLAVTFGVGYQVAVTPNPIYHNNLIVSVRFPF